MNSIEAIGANKREKRITHEVVFMCIDVLMPRIKTLDISVIFEKDLDVYGYCIEVERSRVFELTIRKSLCPDELVTTLCHEMVHVKQYARKELVRRSNYVTWTGNEIIEDGYHKLPWEIEAYELGPELEKMYRLT